MKEREGGREGGRKEGRKEEKQRDMKENKDWDGEDTE